MNANEIAGVLVLMWPAMIAFVIYAREVRHEGGWIGSRWAIALSAVATAGVGLVIPLTLSRSAIIGVCFSIALLALLRRRLFGSARVVIVGAYVLFLTGWLTLVSGGSIGGVPNGFGQFFTSQLLARQVLWSTSLQMVHDFPATGIGLNTYPLMVQLLYPPSTYGADLNPPHSHNFYLQTALDYGLPGLLALVWMLGIAIRLLWDAVQSAPGREHGLARGLANGIAAGLAGHLIYGFTDAVTLGAKPGFLLWWTLAFAEIVWRGPRLAKRQPRAGLTTIGTKSLGNESPAAERK